MILHTFLHVFCLHLIQTQLLKISLEVCFLILDELLVSISCGQLLLRFFSLDVELLGDGRQERSGLLLCFWSELVGAHNNYAGNDNQAKGGRESV